MRTTGQCDTLRHFQPRFSHSSTASSISTKQSKNSSVQNLLLHLPHFCTALSAPLGLASWRFFFRTPSPGSLFSIATSEWDCVSTQPPSPSFFLLAFLMLASLLTLISKH